MIFRIHPARIPIISWFGIRNPYKATVTDQQGEIIADIYMRDGVATFLDRNDKMSYRSKKESGRFEITDSSGCVVTKLTMIQGGIEITQPPLGKLETPGFGRWKCAWGAIYIPPTRLLIEVDILDSGKLKEFLLVGYLSYFNLPQMA